ncbi:MAG: UDP-N-acetylenolpyruvoylglucosamine reductase, partial [Deltaproteobacteria bacterium]|nr:UDP-N-acetylenolpyruvoylglucosamine reductase [Deltaproteobacteria bacterium]
GHQVSDHLQCVRVVDRERAEVLKLPTSACALAYRDSAFKGPWRDRYVITRVTFALNRGAPTTPRHGELASALNALGHMPTLAEIRETVLGLRRAKGMVYSPDDPQSHSAGSFFVNPVVTESDFATIRQGAKRAGFLGAEDHLPHYPADEGHVKLAAAWLIEHAGFPKGYVHGHVGLSTHHALAIVNRGGGKAHEIVALASAIQRAVWRHFGVTLRPEPVFLGLAAPTLDP